MKIDKKLINATMFAAMLLGASITTQNAKADNLSNQTNDDDPATSTISKTKVYNGFETTTDQKNDQPESQIQTDDQTDGQKNNTASNNSQTQATDQVTKDENQTTDQTATTTNNSTDQFKPQNDYYDYVNHKWQTSTDVSKTKANSGAILTTQNSVDQQVQQKFYDYLNGTEHTTDPTMQKALNFYNLMLSQKYQSMDDFSKDAVDNIMDTVNTIDSLQDVNDLSDHLNQLFQAGVTLPFGMKVDIDQNNPKLRALYFYGGSPVLLTSAGDLNQYNEQSQETLGKFLTSAGVNFDAVAEIMKNTKQFDQILTQYQTPTDVQTDLYQQGYTGSGIRRLNDYLPVNYLNFEDLSAFVDMDKFVDQTVGETPGYIFEMTPSFYNNINKIINPDNFQKMKSWMVANYVLDNAAFMNDLVGDFPTVEGETSTDFNQRFAYYLTKKAFANEFSKYFGDVLLTKESKNAVTDMANQLVSAYKTEIQQSSWLSAQGKQAALDKLNNIKVNIGYPTDSYSYYDRIAVPSSGNFYSVFKQLIDGAEYQPYLDYDKPVDRTEWGNISSLKANAQYYPTRNAIYVVTGFIQSPFFDVNQTDSQNYGGLGSIIGHELSHAFDGTGSLYDSNGLFDSWWTAQDLEIFNQKYQQMINDFDGKTFLGVPISGEQTVNENLADSAGFDVDELALQQKGGANWQQFFDSYATINRYNYYTESKNSVDWFNNQQLVAKDVHAPFPMRVNTNLANNDLFAKVYHLKAGDGMWIDPDQRFSFWS